MILTGGHLLIGKCPMSYPGTSHWCRTQNNYRNWKQRLAHCHLIWLSPDFDFFMPPKLRPCIWINIIFGSFEGSTFFCLPTFWSTLGGWVNRCFRWRVRWIERYSSDSWSKNHMSKLPPKHHHPKTAPNIIKNLRCDGIEQWNFNQPPTTPGVPPATILRWYERDHHAVSMCTATWCVLQGWNCRAISVFRNGWSCSV